MTGEQDRYDLDVALHPSLEAEDELSGEALDEMAALAEAEATAAEAEQAAEAEELAAVRVELEGQRRQTRAAVERYREALLTAEPQLPPELVSGETLEDVEASAEAARRAVAQIRERLSQESDGERGFPVGAPARGAASTSSMSATEKIALGLGQQARSR